jgi:hypothetical protein
MHQVLLTTLSAAASWQQVHLLVCTELLLGPTCAATRSGDWLWEVRKASTTPGRGRRGKWQHHNRGQKRIEGHVGKR